MTVTHGAELAAIPAVGVGLLVALTFTPELISAWAVGAAGIVTGILAGVAAIITAWRTTRKVEEVKAAVTQKVEENTAITQEVKAAVKVVEGHVNSAATKSDAIIEALQKEAVTRELQIAELKQMVALSTQAQVLTTQALSAAGHRPADSASQPAAIIEAPAAQIHLEKIETNTKDTVVALTDALKDSTTDTVKAVKDAIKEQP